MFCNLVWHTCIYYVTDTWCLFGQVECILFPDIKNLYLRTVGPDESLVTNIINKAKDVFNNNNVGPKK